MTPNEIAGRCAEEVFRTVEREQMFNKRQITEAIEQVLLTQQTHYTAVFTELPEFSAIPPGEVRLIKHAR